MRGVNRFQGLIRSSVASAGNDHRLGANEAPPAIISIFLGDMLTDIFGQIENGGAKATRSGGILETGVTVLPKLPRDAGDRNRTSPFAFTGNKFEFRAVGSSQNIAFSAISLNVAVTESLDYIATHLENAVSSGRKLEEAVKELLVSLMKENKRIVFNGNGYSSEWHAEAERRGLLNLKTSVDAYGELVKPEVVKTFEKYKVLNDRELHARYDVNVEAYCKSVNVEAQLMVLMANRYILPAALEYQTGLANAINATKAAGVEPCETPKLLARLASLVADFRRRTETLAEACAHEPNGSMETHSRFMRDQVIPAMNALRETGDTLETIVPHTLWPLPTYREMLFIK
jgi:glutamine synthetase